MTIKQALISVSDKSGIIELSQQLIQCGITILSTGGTAKLLQEAGIAVTDEVITPVFPKCWMAGSKRTLKFTPAFLRAMI